MNYSNLDIDLYASACNTANITARAAQRSIRSGTQFLSDWEAVSADWASIAMSLRPSHYEGPDN